MMSSNVEASVDLSQFDTREKAHEGVEVPLEIDGEVIKGDDGGPVTFTMKGIADPEVHTLILKGSKTDRRTSEEVMEADLKLARVACTGWSANFTLKGEKVPFTRDNITRVFSIPLIRRTILAKIYADQLFLKGS